MRHTIITLILFFASLNSFSQNIGIGTTSPNHPLTVAADASYKGIAQKNGTVEIGFWTSSSGAYVQTWSPHDLNFATNNGATRMTLSNGTGYFGIGTTVPSALLDIAGTFRLRGNGAALGSILVSDALGNATWQPLGTAGGWSLVGNAGTNPATNFLGTTDNQPLVFRQNNVYAGRFHYALRNYFIGNYAGINTTAPFNIAMGDSALNDNVSGYSNIALGSGALQQSPSFSNLVAVGDSALFRNGSYNDFSSSFNATRNTAVGSKALYSNTTGFGNTAVGFEAGYANAGGYNNTVIGRWAMHFGGGAGAEGNVAVGAYALDSNQNIHNTAVGAFAMRRNRTGIRNTAVGNSALFNNYSGSNNSALGYYALNGNVDGYNNAAVGYLALGANKAGYANVAVGNAALSQSDNYYYNVAIGDSALYESGSYNDFSGATNNTRNTGVGAKALFTAKNGYGNTALGYEAGYRMGLAWNNTAIGAYAMRNGGGNGAEGNVAVGRYALDSNNNFHNTSVGDFSMRRNKSGINNTAVGYSAMDANIAGSQNTAIGYGAGVSNATTVNNATAIGSGAYVSQSNSLVLGSSSTAVGIGTSAPAHALDIQTNSAFGGKAQLRLHETDNDFARLKFTNASSSSYWDVAGAPNNTIANAALNFYFSGYGDVMNVRGDGTVGIGTGSPQATLHLQHNSEILRLQGASSYLSFYNSAATYIGYLWNRSDASIDLGTASGSGLPVTISPGVTTAATFTAAGNVGIGISIPSQKLHVVGNICYTGTIGACSDIRYKTDFAPVQNALPSLQQIHPIYYYWKKEYKDKGFTDARQIGFSAQEIETLYPEMVQTDGEGYKAVDYSRMTVVLLQAVKEQQAVIEKQQSLLEAMEKRLSALEKK